MQVTSYQLQSTDLNLNEALLIDGTLELDPKANVTITTTKNIIVSGKLISHPNPAVVHTIRFTGIDENKFLGGGDAVLESDIGIWVIATGQLDLQGMQQPTFDKGVVNPDTLTQFVATQTRNMRIEGTATGQAHLFIKSSQPQFIRYVQFRWLGPRRDLNGDGVKELVTGRYACHFHHSDDGSRGSIIEGCIARDCGNHCFVPHGSHGIAMRDNIAYNVTETPFWYDLGHRTNDLLWENNLVVNVAFVPRSQDQDSDMAPTFGAGGFVLGFGDGNICRGNTVIATSGDRREGGAFIWPEIRNDQDISLQLESQWVFEGNTAINCPAGISDWQNNNFHHIVRNTTIINCPVPIFHGAYQNDFHFIGGRIIGGATDLKAASATTNRIRFENIEFDAAGADYCVKIDEGPLTGAAPVLFLNCTFKNYNKKAIINQNPGPGLKTIEVANCGLPASEYQVNRAALSGEWIKVQDNGKAWKITKSGITQIALFAPQQWGSGAGLKAEYYTPDFKTLLLARIEPNINLFDFTHPSPHYLVPTSFAARWTGKIQPQVTGVHTFTLFAGGGARLRVNGQPLIDKWEERYPGEITGIKIPLVAGQLYDIKLEFFNNDDRSGCMLYWSCGIIKKSFIPMGQLYPAQ